MPRVTKKTVKSIPYARGFKRPSKQQQNVAIGSTTHSAYKVDIESFFPDLPLPRSPDDWLAQYVEKGQTVEEFRSSTPWLSNRKLVRYGGCFEKSGRTMKEKYPGSKITLVEIIMEDEEERIKPDLEKLCSYSSTFLQVAVEKMPPIKIKREGEILSVTNYPKHRLQYREEGNNIQLCCASVLSLLRSIIGAEALCLVGVTMCDLYQDKTDLFIAGLAQGNRRVAVFSFCRYDPTLAFSQELWYEQTSKKINTDLRIKTIQARSSKILVHEICHLLGLDHCIYFACVMNGSGHLAEDYSQPHHLCPVCLRKLSLLTGLCEMDRYQELESEYKAMGCTEEETWCGARAATLNRNTKQVSQDGVII